MKQCVCMCICLCECSLCIWMNWLIFCVPLFMYACVCMYMCGWVHEHVHVYMSVVFVCANLNGSYVFHVLQRLPFTTGFIASMAATIYVSMVMHSYILSVAFSGIQVCSTLSLPSLLFILYAQLMCKWMIWQVFALLYYVVSYFPGGSSGMKFLSSMVTSSILKCFGR